jgi:hypothetical protein
MRQPTDTEPPAGPATGLVLLRYGIGGVMVLAGIVMLIVNPSGLGVDGFAGAEVEAGAWHPDARRRGGTRWTRR